MALGERRFRYKRAPEPKLQLTSMMDMFTIIMIFLLVSFSSRPDAFQLDHNIELPKSSAKMDYTKSVQLVLSKDKLQLDGEVLGAVEGDHIAGLDPVDLKASQLYQKLRLFREEADAETAAAESVEEAPNGSDGAAPPHVLFFCDRTLSFQTINQVIKTAGMAGYPNLQFAVLQE